MIYTSASENYCIVNIANHKKKIGFAVTVCSHLKLCETNDVMECLMSDFRRGWWDVCLWLG